MAILKMYKDRLRHNHQFLDQLFREKQVHWGVVSKLLCGNELFLKELLALGVEEIHDSRVSNLRRIKRLAPHVQTVYIKPPPKRSIRSIVRFADVSLNTSLETIQLLSEEAVRQQKLHKIIIMIEMGDLREGVMGDDLVDFYARVFELPGIEVIGLGANLNCMNGIMPSQDKLIQLSLYKQIIELKFDRKIPWISGGSSVTIPLLFRHQLPEAINHFRIGETLYFGLDLFSGEVVEGMEPEVFEVFAEVIEVSEKPVVPFGEAGENPYGEATEIDPGAYGRVATRIILDLGSLDVNPDFIEPKLPGLHLAGISSDMMVLEQENGEASVEVGQLIPFKIKYMGALQLINSPYVEKEVE